jgi:hypothetical protein
MGSSETAAATPNDALRTQVDLLRTYSQNFDDGNEDFALLMATALRVLLHDTRLSHSVFQQARRKDKAHFTDTAHPITPGNLVPSFGLLIARLTTGSGGEYLARSAAGVPPWTAKQPALPFEKWSNTPIESTPTETGGLA